MTMESKRKFWRRWAGSLRRYNLHNLTAALLEAGSPFALLGAQTLYIGGGLIKNEQLSSLAEMLEEENETRAFISFLMREGEDA